MQNKTRRYEITAKDLPLHCPTDDMELWSLHPRVFINVTADKPGKCPYCGNEYVLVEESVAEEEK